MLPCLNQGLKPKMSFPNFLFQAVCGLEFLAQHSCATHLVYEIHPIQIDVSSDFL